MKKELKRDGKKNMIEREIGNSKLFGRGR